MKPTELVVLGIVAAMMLPAPAKKDETPRVKENVAPMAGDFTSGFAAGVRTNRLIIMF